MNLKQALIDNDSIRLGLEANNWKEAVKVAVDPLIESGEFCQSITMLSLNRLKSMGLTIS